MSIGPLSESYFVVEGDLPAVRKAKRLLERGGARVIELRSGTKPLYFAANLLATAITIPALQLAQQTLRASGVSGTDLELLTAEWSNLLLNRFKKGGRATWGGPLAECSQGVANEQFRQLGLQDPVLAASVHEWLNLARRQMEGRSKGQSA
jgi:predicted short-subunit dehydrogenase-like oxidoreductase (DUF2520 family)